MTRITAHGTTYVIPQAGDPAVVERIGGLLAALLVGAEPNGSQARTTEVPHSAPTRSAARTALPPFSPGRVASRPARPGSLPLEVTT